jgi:cysteate synthase
MALVVPERSLHRLWMPAKERNSLFLIAVKGDYYDSICLGDQLGKLDGSVPEGGTKNIARRDGMGTVMLDATLTMGRLPDFYFQAVGSGAGGIAAWEASIRLIRDGRFGEKLPMLNLAQNVPCAPLYSATHPDSKLDPSCPQNMYDDVLFNRKPPYSVGGGVGDALSATHGLIHGVSNDEADRAREMFQRAEGIDILPAPAIAVAALLKASEAGTVSKDDTILLNITGGGEKELRRVREVHTLKPDLTLETTDCKIEGISEQITRDLGDYL